MRFTIFTTALALGATAAALPTSSNYVLHEKRSESSSWSPREDVKPNGRIRLPVRIGLTENNLDMGEDVLLQVSDPASEHYGKHWTTEQVSIALGQHVAHD